MRKLFLSSITVGMFFCSGSFLFSGKAHEGCCLHGKHGEKNFGERFVEKKLEKLTSRYDLTPEQQVQARKILEEQKQKLEELWKRKGEEKQKSKQEIFKQKKAIKEAYHEQLKSILTEEQKKKFKEKEFECQKECCKKKGS